MLSGNFRGRPIGSGTDVWRYSEEVKAGTMSLSEFHEAETCMSRSAGHCMTMGTASTMACMIEALGLGLPQNAATPASDSRRLSLAHLAGRRIVEMVHEDLRISKILTREAFENAIRVNGAVGGSTNAVIHSIAIAGRIEVDLSLGDWDTLGREIKTVVNLMPSGQFLMEDFYYAGGLPTVIRLLGENNLIHRDALTVNGKTIWENCQDAPNWNDDVIRPLTNPLAESGGIAILRGNLAPDGAVIKPSAASSHLLSHRGPAVVFDSIEDYHLRIDAPDLDVDENSVLVLKNCGPRGYPGMPEVGNMGLPSKILRRGVTDMIRISDARMSGTAYGTVILHVAPEAAVGGPLALVRNGDIIDVDVTLRKLNLEVSEEELAERRSQWTAPEHAMKGGYQQLYRDRVTQADKGADFDFLVGCRGAGIPRESH
jgi:dihydroxy-acid dehydratase